MSMNVVLVDLNSKMVDAWEGVFSSEPHVEIVRGSILVQRVDAWVSPTNAQGEMGDGVEGAIRKHLGESIQQQVRRAIARDYGGAMPVGDATCVATGQQKPSWLISTPTTGATEATKASGANKATKAPKATKAAKGAKATGATGATGGAEAIRDTLNVALACCAAFQAVTAHNAKGVGGIGSIAIPGLGAGTGMVSPSACAELMWAAYGLFCRHYFDDFASMREALEAEMGAFDPATSSDEAARRLREVMFARAGVDPGGPASKPDGS